MYQVRHRNVYETHHKRRELLRSLKGNFKPTSEDLEEAKKSFFQGGGRVQKLEVTQETKPGIWGDFVKSRIKVS